jgi:hypothetical protein
LLFGLCFHTMVKFTLFLSELWYRKII